MADQNTNTGIQFEDIVPWMNDSGDTGLSSRLKLKRNFDKIKVWMDNNALSVDVVRTMIATLGAELFLSKVDDDTAAGFITMLKGLQVGSQFVPDILGQGGVFRVGTDGKVELVTDKLYARVSAYFDNVEIRDYKHSGGNRIASQAQGFTCSRVEWIQLVEEELDEETVTREVVLEQTQENLPDVDFFRCYWRVDDGEKKTDNQFIIGDLAFCESAEVANDSLATKRYWRVVIGRNNGNTTTEDGEAWVDLSNAHDANGLPVMTTITYQGQGGVEQTMQVLSFDGGSGIPETKDDICQLGDVRDTTRQGAIIEYVTGIDAPSYQIFQGIGADAANPYSLENKNMITIGYDSASGKAKMEVFGDAYIGDRNRNTYIEYKQNGTGGNPELNIKAKISAQSTIGNSSLSQFVKNNQNNYDDAWIHTAVNDLQSQIDGEIDSWFYNYMPVASIDSKVPLTNKEPYKTWYEADNGGTESEVDTERTKHLGDTFYDNSSGYAFRFSLNENTNAFEWNIITDSAVVQALANAAKAQETADGKRATYSTWGAWMKNNINTLQVGDLFIPTTDYTDTSADPNVTYKAKKVYKCTTDATNAFEEVAYTDDSALNDFKALTYVQQLTNGTLAGNVTNAINAANRAQTTANDARTSAINANNKLTAWADDGKISPTEILALKNQKTDVMNEYAQIIADAQRYDIAHTNFTTAYNAAIKAFSYHTNEVDTDDDGENDDVSNADGTITIITDSTSQYYYGNISAYYAARQTILNSIATAAKTYAYNQAQAAKDYYLNDAVYKAIAHALGGQTDIEGGLILTSLIGMRSADTVEEGAAQTYTTWGGISGEYDAQALGGGIAAWYGGAMVDYEAMSDVDKAKAWTETRYAKTLFRFDGSGYLAGGNISWDEDGTPRIKGVTLTTSDGTVSMNVADIASRDWVKNTYITKDFFNAIFQLQDSEGNAIAPNSATTAKDRLKILVGAYTDQYLSALGLGPDGGGSSGSLATLTDVALTDLADGQMLVYNAASNHWINAAVPNTYTLPAATANALGGIKIGYSAIGKNYAVQLDSSNKAYVNVPWTDTTYTLAGLMGATAIGGANQPIYWNGSAFAKTTYTLGKSVPSNAVFTDTNTWRNIYLDGSSKVGTGTGTKAINFKAGSHIALSYVAAGTGEDDSGSADYFNIKIDVTNVWDSSASRTANTVLAAPNGSAGAATFRALVAADIPDLAASKITSGTFNTARIPTLAISKISGLQAALDGKLNLTGGTLTGSLTAQDIIIQSNNTLKIGDAYLAYDSTNNAIKLYRKNENDEEIAANFYALGGISALGQGVDGGGGGAGDVTWDLLANNTDTRQIALSHLTTALGTLTSYTTSGKNYAVQKDASNHLYVNVPWENTTYESKAAASGGTAVSLVTTGEKYTWNNKSDLTIGTTATTAAAGNHTHTLSIAADSGTNALTLAASTKYKLTAGGSTFIFTTPPNTTYSEATTSVAGLMSARDKSEHDANKYVSLSQYTTNQEYWHTFGRIARAGGSQLNFTGILYGLGDFKKTTGVYLVKFRRYNENYNPDYTVYCLIQASAIAGLEFGYYDDGTYIYFGYKCSTRHRLLFLKPLTNYGVTIVDSGILTTAPEGWTAGVYKTYADLDSTQALTNKTYNGYTLAAACAKAVTDSSSASAISTSTNLPTERDIYYGLPTINNSHAYTSSTTIYAPTSGGTSGQVLIAQGATSTPAWTAQSNLSVGYASSAGKAEQLNTSRTLWGQGFDGTANVSGNMSSVGNISFSATGKNIGSIAYFDTTNSRLGVGTSSPSYKLHVGGTFYASGNSSVGGTFGVTGATTLTGLLTANGNIATGTSDGAYIQIGGARIVWDNTNSALKVIKSDNSTAANFYATGAISALGQGVDGGGGGAGDVTWDLLANNTDTRQIALSHLTTALGTLTSYTTSGKNYAVQKDASNHLYVNVPWENTTYESRAAASGGTAVSLVTTGEKYAWNNPTLTIAADSGTNALTLAASTRYKLTAGGSTFIFTTPPNTTYSEATASAAGLMSATDKSEHDANKYVSLSQYTTSGTQYWHTFGRVATAGGSHINFTGILYGIGSYSANNTCGVYLVEYRRYGASYNPQYYVTCLIPASVSDLSFGYYDDGTYIYFGYTCKTHHRLLYLKPLTNNGVTIVDSGILTTAPEGWTAGVYKTYADLDSTQALTNKTYNGYTLAAACAKGVTDNSSATAVTSTDTNLITGRTLYYAGYTKNTGTITSITLKAGTGISLDVDNTAITTSGTRTISLASGVCTAGTYKSVTVDTYGRVTAGTNPTTLNGYGITDALSTSGGTLTGELKVNMTNQPVLLLQVNGVNKAQYGYHYQDGLIIYNYQAEKGLNISNNGILSYDGYTIWNSGNDGSGSTLDADLLDGQHGSYYATASSLRNYLPLSGGTLTGLVSSSAEIRATGFRNTTETTFINDSCVFRGASNGQFTRILSDGIGICDANINGTFVIGYDGTKCYIYQNIGKHICLQASAGSGYTAGNVGIGTNSPSDKLHVSGNTKVEGELKVNTTLHTTVLLQVSGTNKAQFGYHNNYGIFIHNYVSDSGIGINNSGNVIIGNVGGTASYKLHVVGDIYATGGVTSLSDIRKKDVQGGLNLNVEQVANAPAIRFLWKADHSLGMQAGTIAQYWQEVLPEVVTDKNDELSLQYGVAALVASITTARKVVDHERRISELERENKYLKEQIKQLKAA